MITKSYKNKMSVEEKLELVWNTCRDLCRTIGIGNLAYIIKIDEVNKTVLESRIFINDGVDISGDYDEDNLYSIMLDSIQWIQNYDYLVEVRDAIVDRLNKMKPKSEVSSNKDRSVDSNDNKCDQDCETCFEGYLKDAKKTEENKKGSNKKSAVHFINITRN